MQETGSSTFKNCQLCTEPRWQSVEEFLCFRIERLTKWKEENNIDLSEQKMFVGGSIEEQYYNMGRRQGFKEVLAVLKDFQLSQPFTGQE